MSILATTPGMSDCCAPILSYKTHFTVDVLSRLLIKYLDKLSPLLLGGDNSDFEVCAEQIFLLCAYVVNCIINCSIKTSVWLLSMYIVLFSFRSSSISSKHWFLRGSVTRDCDVAEWSMLVWFDSWQDKNATVGTIKLTMWPTEQ